MFYLSFHFVSEISLDNPEYQEPEAFQLQQVPTDSANEPTALCQLQNNIAYEIPTSKIKTAENEAYGAISNLQDLKPEFG